MKRTRLRRRSTTAARQHARYLAFVGELAAEDGRCQVGPRIALVDPRYRDCSGAMEGLHHIRKRSQGGALIDRANVLRSCNLCNGWVEDHPELAYRVGLVSRGTVVEPCPMPACVGWLERTRPFPTVACPWAPAGPSLVEAGGTTCPLVCVPPPL